MKTLEVEYRIERYISKTITVDDDALDLFNKTNNLSVLGIDADDLHVECDESYGAGYIQINDCTDEPKTIVDWC